MKTCNVCHKQLPLNAFHVNYRNKTDGHEGKCRACRSLYNKQHYTLHPDKYNQNRKPWDANAWLKKHYNLTLLEKEEMLKQQKDKCLICKEHLLFDNAKVDHCHESNKVRGLLCHRCNTAIGLLRDKPEFCDRASVYLTTHKLVG